MATTDPQPNDPPIPLWAEGRFTLVVRGPAGEPPQTINVLRPYALIGRLVGADARIDDRRVSARHCYLHLDRRGLFVIDLATRTGTRVGKERRGAGWLAVGGALEVADHRIEVAQIEVAGGLAPDDSDPLADARSHTLTRVTLYPARSPESPLALGSEFVFLGRSPNCGVHVEGASAARTHCVLVRAQTSAFVVDLTGRGTWLNDRPLRGAAPLIDGDSLMIGTARFEVRVEPPNRNHLGSGRSLATTRIVPPAPVFSASLPAIPAELLALEGVPNLPPGLNANEAQAAFLGWMMAVLQNSQSEMLRRQDEFHHDMVRLLGQMQRENTTVLNRHLERVEAINHELSALRDQIGRQFGANAPALPPTEPPVPRPAPIPIAPAAAPSDPAAATQWLLSRVRNLEQENRSSWRDLISRLGGSGR
jgi:pSer/pThr/pTyr-binding forkhead associated (FHA) protein